MKKLKKSDWEAVYLCKNKFCITGSVWITFKKTAKEDVPLEQPHECGSTMKRSKMTIKGSGQWIEEVGPWATNSNT